MPEVDIAVLHFPNFFKHSSLMPASWTPAWFSPATHQADFPQRLGPCSRALANSDAKGFLLSHPRQPGSLWAAGRCGVGSAPDSSSG